MATLGSVWGPAVFSYFGILFVVVGDRDRDPAPGCCTLGLLLTGEPISSRVFTVEVGEGTRACPGWGTEGFLIPGEERDNTGASPGIRTLGSLSSTGESEGDSTSAIVSSTLH